MAAYAIFIREITTNPAELQIYGQKAGAAAAGHALKPLALYGRQQVLEGPPCEGVVILEFPTLEDARAWYDSPAYAEAREHRFKGAEYRALLVEGI
jgi:uncharacterized protein (DUF1330 family)